MAKETLDIREHAFAFGDTAVASDRIDRLKGVVRGPLKILGLKSVNGKDYLPSATRAAIPLIEAAPSYIDHPQGKSNARSIRDRFGRPRGVYADQNGELWAKEYTFNPHHSYADEFCWLVENDSRGIGFSINAEGFGTRDAKSGRIVVDEIPHVYSVDLVAGPGTVGGLFEQGNNMPAGAALTDPAANPLTTPDPTDGAGAGGTGDHKDALAEAVAALASELKSGTCDHATAKKKINSILKLLAGEDKEPDAKEGTPEATKLTEQLIESPLPEVRWAGRTLRDGQLTRLIESKLTAAKLPENAITDTFRVQLREAADPAKIDALIADRKAVAGVGVGAKPRQLPPEPPSPEATRTATELREQAKPEPDAVKKYVAKING